MLRRNTSPGTMKIARRITSSCVIVFPTILIRLTIAGAPSRICQRRSTTLEPSVLVRRDITS